MDVKLDIAQVLYAVVVVPSDERYQCRDSVLHMCACIPAAACILNLEQAGGGLDLTRLCGDLSFFMYGWPCMGLIRH